MTEKYLLLSDKTQNTVKVSGISGVLMPRKPVTLPKTAAVWHFGDEQFNRTMSTVAIADGLLYISDLSGYLYCLDVNTGDLYWKT